MFFFAPERLVLVAGINLFEQLPLRQGDGVVELTAVFDGILQEFLQQLAGFFIQLFGLFHHNVVGRLLCAGAGIIAGRGPTTNQNNVYKVER